MGVQVICGASYSLENMVTLILLWCFVYSLPYMYM